MAVGAVLIALKLAGAIGWPWWLVLSPMWAEVALGLLCVAVLVVVQAVDERKGKGRAKPNET